MPRTYPGTTREFGSTPRATARACAAVTFSPVTSAKYWNTAPIMFVDNLVAAVPLVSLPWSSAKISPPAFSTRSITSSCTFSDRTSRSKYATTM